VRWAVVFPAVLAVASCDEPGVHILTGQLYEPLYGCIDTSKSVDVVQGPSTGDSCDPQCLTITAASQTSVYVTTMCPPFPGDYTVEAQDAATGDADPCVSAFALYNLDGGLCPAILPEGGGTEASTGDDGGGDAAGDGPGTD
jgi:hypothetical protein